MPKKFVMKPLVKCPKCHAEYLPCEIFSPKEFLGNIKNIRKNEKGKILHLDVIETGGMNLDSWYICDYCNHKFHAYCWIQFRSVLDTCEEKFENAPTLNDIFSDMLE